MSIDKSISDFPNKTDGGIHEHQHYEAGMSLRDYFAAYAMQGMLTTSAAPALGGLDGAEDRTAKAAYKLADAMLKAREN